MKEVGKGRLYRCCLVVVKIVLVSVGLMGVILGLLILVGVLLEGMMCILILGILVICSIW